MPATVGRRIEIGGGPTPGHPEFEQFDANDWAGRTGLAYTRGDARHLPYDDESVDELFASNILEHISHLETVATLREWRRVLAPAGRLTIVVPDLLGLYRDLMHSRNTFAEFVERVYGSQTYELDVHRAGFTLARFADVLQSAGLEPVDIRQTHQGGGITAVATRGA